MTKKECEEDLNIYTDLKWQAIRLTQVKESVYSRANTKTVPYKRMHAFFETIFRKTSELHMPIMLRNEGMLMLDTAINNPTISQQTYKGAVNDVYNRWIKFLNKRIEYCQKSIYRLQDFESNCTQDTDLESKADEMYVQSDISKNNEIPLEGVKEANNMLNEEAVTDTNTISNSDEEVEDNTDISISVKKLHSLDKTGINLNEINLDMVLNKPIREYYNRKDLQKIFVSNMNKVLDILNKGKLEFGNTDFDALLLYISNIYEALKTFDVDSSLISETNMAILRRVRINTCHGYYHDSTCLVEVCAAIGVLVSLVCAFKS